MPDLTTPTTTPGAPPFDINALIAAFSQMAQVQGQQRLAAQHQFFHDTNPLGNVAQQNSRPPGLTPEADWRAMFPHPAGETTAGANYAPSPISASDAAFGASQPSPAAAAFHAMPAQSPFTGAQPGMPAPVVPPTTSGMTKKGTSTYRPPLAAFGASAMPGFSF